MTLFLRQKERFRSALETFDPLQGTWMLGLIDPWPGKREDANPLWGRVAGLLAFLLLPMALGCISGNPALGGKFVGRGSFTADIGVYSILICLLFATALLPIGRRLLGDLINELISRGVVDDGLRSFDPWASRKGWLLRAFEWLTRVDGYRGVIWIGIMLADQLVVYWMVLMPSGHTSWLYSPAVPGSALYFLSVGSSQPNFAGLWAATVWAPVGLYLMIVIARLLVVYACLCESIARNKALLLIPTHPDRTGGLRPIGQASLFLSLFTFAAGIDLAGLTLNELVADRAFAAAGQQVSVNLMVLMGTWVLYFLIGTALFLLPMLPLRRKMAQAKRKYLLSAVRIYSTKWQSQQIALEQGAVKMESLEALGTIESLYLSVKSMAVWPFDTVTALRYGGLLVSPLLPIIANQAPALLTWVGRYLGGG